MFYRAVIRPVLFRIDPEKVHHIVSYSLKLAFRIPGMNWLSRKIFTVEHPLLERELFGLKFPNPVGVAAGFDKNATLFHELSNLGFGFVEVGTVTPKPQPGNPKPRLFRLPDDGGLINRMGFNNLGLRHAVEQLKQRGRKGQTVLIGGNLGKNTLTPNAKAVDDYACLFEGMFDWVDYFVVNVSCPNITDLRELQNQESLMEILVRLQGINHKKKNPKPILLKVSPDLNMQQLDEVIDLVEKTKIDGVVAVNTTVTRHLLKTSVSQVQEIGRGGLSGKPLSQRALEVVRYLSEKSGKAFPIIGVGGIFTAEDAIAMLDAGADLVQVYTGFIYEGPFLARRINKALLKKNA